MSERGAYYGSSYDRYSESTDDSTTHKLKNAFWTTKQVVIKKFGRKEDEHVVASDCELDAKLELFRSIQKTCMDLTRIIDRYQDRICVLSQAENELGRFLKNHGGEDKTRAGKMMTAVGKSLSFSAQQRLALRVPLARLQQEVETFRYRAISDTLQTLMKMEQRRTDYRAALLWMRDVSENLDPDTYKQLDKFRKVQAQVRKTKGQFDKMKLDSMQKVDLLAASRCNMFSHVLSLYQSTLLQFWEKTCRTMVAVADSFKGYQYYEFSMLKDLTDESRKLAELTRGPTAHNEEKDLLGNDDLNESKSTQPLDEFDDLNKRLDEMFTADYKDDPENDIKAAMENNKIVASKKEAVDCDCENEEIDAEKTFLKMSEETLEEFISPECKLKEEVLDLFVKVSSYLGSYSFNPILSSSKFTDVQSVNEPKKNSNSDILGLGIGTADDQEGDRAFFEDLLVSEDKSDSIFDDFIGQPQKSQQPPTSKQDWEYLFGSDVSDSVPSMSTNSTNASQMLAGLMPSALLDTRSKFSGMNAPNIPSAANNRVNSGNIKSKVDKKDGGNAAWLSMFADLDPLANPDAISKKEGQITDT